MSDDDGLFPSMNGCLMALHGGNWSFWRPTKEKMAGWFRMKPNLSFVAYLRVRNIDSGKDCKGELT